MMKTVLVVVASAFILSACGKSEARKECEQMLDDLKVTSAMAKAECEKY